MKSKAKILLTGLLTAALLASCGEGKPKNPSSSGNTPTPTSGEKTSETPTVQTYKIVDKTSNGVTLALSATEAKPGETINIVATLAENYTLLSLMMNGKELTATSENHYSFTMPDTSVVLTSRVSVSGDVVVQGDLAAPLEKQGDGTYKGSLTVENDAKVTLNASGVTIGFESVDLNRSYGNMTSAYLGKPSSITLAGNAVYEITYDPSASTEDSVVIYRTKALHAPKTAEEVLDLFGGDYAGRNLLDGGTYNVRGLTHADYTNEATGVTYTWDSYGEKESYATAVHQDTGVVDHVHRKILDSGIYQVVDQYVEAVKDSDGEYYDTTAFSDTVAYAAKYAVSSADPDTLSNYQINGDYAKMEIALPSHNLHSLENEIEWGYRTGVTVEDYLTAASVVFTPTENADGSFSVSITTWLNYDWSKSVQGYSTSRTGKSREEYAINIAWDSASRPVSAEMTLKEYNESSWTFDDTSANGGTKKSDVAAKRHSTWNYVYGEAKSGDVGFDDAPYFISSLDSVSIKKDDSLSEGQIKIRSTVDERRRPTTLSLDEDYITGYTSLINITYSPSTALDAWQYGVVSSSDDAVIGIDPDYTYRWSALSAGKTTLTIGNHTDNAVTGTVAAEVVAPKLVHSWYVTYDGESSFDEDVSNSQSFSIAAGDIMSFWFWDAPYDTDNAAYPGITSLDSSNPLLTAMVSGSPVWRPTGGGLVYGYAVKVVVDASKMTNTENTSVTITVQDANYASGWRPTQISCTVTPRPAKTWPDSLAGTSWSGVDDTILGESTSSSADKSVWVNAKISFTDETNAVLTVKGKTIDRTLNMTYEYVNHRITKMAVADSSKGSYDAWSVGLTMDKQNRRFGLYVVGETWSYSDGEGTVEYDPVLGYYYGEEEDVEYIAFSMDE